MPSPKKKKPSRAQGARKAKTPKETALAIMKLIPDHPAAAEFADPENEGRTWVVEYVEPPCVFMARSIPEPVDLKALNAEISAAFDALGSAESKQTRYLLGVAFSGDHARRLVECLTEKFPRPAVPFLFIDLFFMDGVFHVVQ